MHKYDTGKNNYNACNYHSWTHYRFAHIFSFPTFQMFQMHHGNKPITSQSSFDSLKLNLTFVKKKIIFKNLFSSNCFLLMQMHVKYRKNPVNLKISAVCRTKFFLPTVFRRTVINSHWRHFIFSRCTFFIIRRFFFIFWWSSLRVKNSTVIFFIDHSSKKKKLIKTD